MGACASSTQAVTDPHTGETKHKKKLGGAYPGNRRPAQQQYQPPQSEFNQNGTATAHFVAYGGGNALVLQQQSGLIAPQTGLSASKPQYIQVTLPPGVSAGEKIHVQAPDGRLNEIVVPPGFGPGSTFTVEFADDPAPTTQTPQYTAITTDTTSDVNQDDGFATGFNNSNFVPPPTAMASPAPARPISVNTYTSHTSSNVNQDDGFATGFNNPNFVPPPTAVASPAPARPPSGSYEPEISVDTYATPVYSSPPQYPSSTPGRY